MRAKHFLSADPIGPLSGSSPFGNRYCYGGYDFANATDPTGFYAYDGGVGGILAAIGETIGAIVGAAIIIGVIWNAISPSSFQQAFGGLLGTSGSSGVDSGTVGNSPRDGGGSPPSTAGPLVVEGPIAFEGRSKVAFAPTTRVADATPSSAWRAGYAADARFIAGSETWVDRSSLSPEQRSAMEAGDRFVAEFLLGGIEIRGVSILGKVEQWILGRLRAARGGLTAADLAKAGYDANKIGHIFDSKHMLDPLVSKLGGQGAALEAMHNAVQPLVNQGYQTGAWVTVQVEGFAVSIKGAVVDGVFRIGTATMRAF